jgi:hypothetical protein
LYSIANKLGMNAADLLAVLTSESGLNPAAANRDESGYPIAVGLNQLTAASNGATGLSEERRVSLLSQPVSAQLPYVEKYFQSQRWTMEGRSYPSAAVIYAVNYLPARVYERGSAPGTILADKNDGGLYWMNLGFDPTRKGYITVGDLGHHLDVSVVHDKGGSGRTYRGALAAMRAATGDAGLSPLTS